METTTGGATIAPESTQSLEGTIESVWSPTFFMNLFYAGIFALGVSANFFVLVLILGFVRLRNATNIYVLNLAIADLLFLIWIPFVIARTSIGQWVWGLALCKMYFIGTTVNQFGSVAFLTCLGIDRYLAVCHPLASRPYRTVKVAAAAVALSWFAVSLLMIPVFMYATTVHIQGPPLSAINANDSDSETGSNHPEDGSSNNSISDPDTTNFEVYETQCMILWPEANSFWSRRTFTIYSVITSYIVPLAIIWILYSLLLGRLRKKRQFEKALKIAKSPNSKKKSRSYRKVTWMVLSVVLSYSICWLPFWILQIVIESLSEEQLMQLSGPGFRSASLMAYCLQYTNSVLNPILYALVSGTFKKVFVGFIKNRGLSLSQRKAQIAAAVSQYSVNENNSVVYVEDEKGGLMKTPEALVGLRHNCSANSVLVCNQNNNNSSPSSSGESATDDSLEQANEEIRNKPKLQNSARACSINKALIFDDAGLAKASVVRVAGIDGPRKSDAFL